MGRSSTVTGALRTRSAVIVLLAGSALPMSASAGVFTDFNFVGAGNVNWNAFTSWDQTAFPNSLMHNAIIASNPLLATTLTLNVNVSLNNFTLTSPTVNFVSSGRTLTIGGNALFNGGVPAVFNGGGIAGTGTVDNFGVLNANSSVSFSNGGLFTNAASGVLNISNGAFSRNTGGFTNQGTINLTSTGVANTTIAGGSTLNNQGILNALPGAGGNRFIGINLNNTGTVNNFDIV